MNQPGPAVPPPWLRLRRSSPASSNPRVGAHQCCHRTASGPASRGSVPTNARFADRTLPRIAGWQVIRCGCLLPWRSRRVRSRPVFQTVRKGPGRLHWVMLLPSRAASRYLPLPDPAFPPLSPAACARRWPWSAAGRVPPLRAVLAPRSGRRFPPVVQRTAQPLRFADAVRASQPEPGPATCS